MFWRLRGLAIPSFLAMQYTKFSCSQMDTNFHITFKVLSLPYEATSYFGKGHQILYDVGADTGIEI